MKISLLLLIVFVTMIITKCFRIRLYKNPSLFNYKLKSTIESEFDDNFDNQSVSPSRSSNNDKPLRSNNSYPNRKYEPKRSFSNDNKPYSKPSGNSFNRQVNKPIDNNKNYRDNNNNYNRPNNINNNRNSYNDNNYSYNRDNQPSQLTIERESFDGDFLYGISPVRIALKHKRRTFTELLMQTGLDVSNKKDDSGANDIINMVNNFNIPIREMSKHDLNMLTDNKPHQGFVLKVSKIEFETIKSLQPETQFKCVLALDEVWDPQNFGALIRTCHFLGLDGIVVCSKNSAPASPTVSKASSGALEATDIYSTINMMKFLDESAKSGWQIVGTALEGKTTSLVDLPLDKPTIVVLGNEGHGIRTNILNRCEYLLKLGSNNRIDTEVDSLNVSVTGGIILHHIMQYKNN